VTSNAVEFSAGFIYKRQSINHQQEKVKRRKCSWIKEQHSNQPIRFEGCVYC